MSVEQPAEQEPVFEEATADAELWKLVDLAHGACLRAKYRLIEFPDREVLEIQLDNLRWCVQQIDRFLERHPR